MERNMREYRCTEIEELCKNLKAIIEFSPSSIDTYSRLFGIIYTAQHPYIRRYLRLIYLFFPDSSKGETLYSAHLYITDLLLNNYRGYVSSIGSVLSLQEEKYLITLSMISSLVSFPKYFEETSDKWRQLYDYIDESIVRQHFKELDSFNRQPFSHLMDYFRAKDDGSYDHKLYDSQFGGINESDKEMTENRANKLRFLSTFV